MKLSQVMKGSHSVLSVPETWEWMKGFSLEKNIQLPPLWQEMNRTHCSKDEEEFDLNEGSVEPYSIILKTDQKKKALMLKAV